MDKILFSIFLIRLCLPAVESFLLAEPGLPEYSEYMRRQSSQCRRHTSVEPQAKLSTHIPEYSDFLRQNTTTVPNATTEQLIINAPYPIPPIYMCKDMPSQGNFFGYIYCWTMIVVSVLAIGTFLYICVCQSIRQQLAKKNRKRPQDLELYEYLPDGVHRLYTDGSALNREDPSNQPENKPLVQGMLPMRPTT